MRAEVVDGTLRDDEIPRDALDGVLELHNCGTGNDEIVLEQGLGTAWDIVGHVAVPDAAVSLIETVVVPLCEWCWLVWSPAPWFKVGCA